MLWRQVGEHEDGLLAHHLIGELVHRHDLVEALFERDPVQRDRGGPILILAIEADGDAVRRADRVHDVAQALVVEAQVQRLARGRVENRLRRRGARPFAHADDCRLRPRRFDAFADGAIEFGDLRRGQPVARFVLARGLVLVERGFELILFLVLVRPVEMRARRRLHGALQRDLVRRVFRRRLRGLAVLDHGLVEVAGALGDLTLAERRPGGATPRQ